VHIAVVLGILMPKLGVLGHALCLADFDGHCKG
jgi:hypothetical protein